MERHWLDGSRRANGPEGNGGGGGEGGRVRGRGTHCHGGRCGYDSRDRGGVGPKEGPVGYHLVWSGKLEEMVLGKTARP